jgi:sporulation-control protein spo0M
VFGIALVAHDAVFEVEFLEQPEDALRTRVVQVVDCDHARSLAGSSPSMRMPDACPPAGVRRNQLQEGRIVAQRIPDRVQAHRCSLDRSARAKGM